LVTASRRLVTASTSFFFFLHVRPHPTSTLFPYTTLFRSHPTSRRHRTRGRRRVQHLRLVPEGHRQFPSAAAGARDGAPRAHLPRSEEHTSELQSRFDLVCRLLLEKKKLTNANTKYST